jgi:hypothetical protein
MLAAGPPGSAHGVPRTIERNGTAVGPVTGGQLRHHIGADAAEGREPWKRGVHGPLAGCRRLELYVRGPSRNAMNPRGSRASRSYSSESMAAASGTGRGSSKGSIPNPAAQISKWFPAVPASTAPTNPCSRSLERSGRRSSCPHGAASHQWDAGAKAPKRRRGAAPGATPARQRPHHLRPAAYQFFGLQPRATRRVKNPLARDISQQRQAGRPVVMGVKKPVLCMLEEFIRKHVVLRLPPHLAVHAANVPTSSAGSHGPDAHPHRSTYALMPLTGRRQRHGCGGLVRLERPASATSPASRRRAGPEAATGTRSPGRRPRPARSRWPGRTASRGAKASRRR